MREIEALQWNGFNVVSTFSGGGGSCLGYRMAGYRVLWANEFIPEAQKTYKANHPNSYLDTRDIRDVKPEDILRQAGLIEGDLDILDGSPPCASFSTAGKREAGWGKVKKYSDKAQRTDDLFFEYARILKGLQPKVFIAENVSGLVKGTAKGYFLDILQSLKKCGYKVKASLLDAAWLGVPQARERLIFVGVREDIPFAPLHPNPLPYQYTVREALHGLASASGLIGMVIGNDAFNPIFGSPDQASPTILASGGRTSGIGQFRTNEISNHEMRRFSIEELRRISSFPDDFKLAGTFAQQWERLGRSVPPLMMKAISSTVRDRILAKLA